MKKYERRTGKVRISNRGSRWIEIYSDKTKRKYWKRLRGKMREVPEGKVPQRCPRCNAGLVCTEMNVKCPFCSYRVF